MDAPEARYLEREGALLAYQVVGDAGADVLVVGEIAQHFDLAWTDPHIHELYERAATYSRTVYLQPRGFGLSEPLNYTPTLEQLADDVVAVLDAVAIPRATLCGTLTTCAVLALVAARHPERVAGLVLFKPSPCGPYAPAARDHGWTDETIESYSALWRAVFERWGSGATVDVFDPVLATSFNRRLMAMLERCSAVPAAAQRWLEFALHVDVSEVLRAVRTPARVLYPPTGNEPEAVVRRVAELLPDATFVRLTPTPPGASIGEAYQEMWDHIRDVATGGHHADVSRFLGTVLFTDVVGSTELLSRLGDAAYRELRAAHERQVRLAVEQDGGRFVSASGDGTLSVFDGPTRAVRVADDICRNATALGLTVRAGVHTGEMERTGNDVTGLAVHIGARIASAAGPGEVLVSQTVRDLATGSGLAFTERGHRELKGVPGAWAVFALSGEAADEVTQSERSLETPLDRAALRTARAAPWAMRAALRVGNAVQRYRARSLAGR